MESIIHPGAALLAVRVGVPVIPVSLEGTAAAWPHGRKWPGLKKVRVKVRPSIDPPQGKGREPVEELVRLIEASLEGATRVTPER
jgi:1-acyl-sn-glycerol-3-phosphate acyltransferase